LAAAPADALGATIYGRVDKSGSAPQTVHLYPPLRFQFPDEVASYLVGPNVDGEQRLYRLTLAGDSFVPLATFEHDQITAVTSDETSIYVGLDSGGIVRISK
ncbi:MAG TPA: hypothetical protein VFK05_36430, partial [Polyangiaceae bacterium]|nr:hypothetical protein [Polyangiaceae bacterium]